MNDAFDFKIKSLDEVKHIAANLKQRGKRVVHCHGVFDLMHLGHIKHLNSAKGFGDVLIVTCTSDKFVKRGPGRPVFKERQRAEALANLAVTDFITVLDYPTAIEAIIAIKPDYYVKGPDYRKKEDDVTAKIFDEEDTVESVGGQLVFTDDVAFSSSQLINNYFDTYPQKTAKYLRHMANKYSADTIIEQLRAIKNMKVLVIGDTIIDQYHNCTPLGKSAKESIVVNKYLSEEDFAGGVLATANHAAQLCDNVELLTVLGGKDSHEDFILTRMSPHIRHHFIVRPDCTTTVKRRFVSDEGNRKLFEVCYIDDHPLESAEEVAVIENLEKRIANFELVIISDFGHGMLTDRIMEFLCDKAKCLALNVQTNGANFGFNLVTKYKRADFICIDERELRLATHDRLGELPSLMERVYDALDCRQIIATRGSAGSLAYNREAGFEETPALASQGIDKVGAGDAFFAYTAPCFAAGVPQDLLGLIGNAVGSLKLQILGNREPVKFADLAKFVTRLLKV